MINIDEIIKITTALCIVYLMYFSYTKVKLILARKRNKKVKTNAFISDETLMQVDIYMENLRELNKIKNLTEL